MSRLLTRWIRSPFVVIGLALLIVAAGTIGYTEAKKNKKPAATGELVASDPCLGNPSGTIKIFTQGNVEKMIVSVQGLPKNTDFDVFVIQKPTPGFGLSWYQGDLKTNSSGSGSQQFLGRFSIETFIVAQAAESITVRPHPNGVFPLADQSGTNPTTGPVHTYHVGLWFNSPNDVPAACNAQSKVTPFNGDHTAGIQALHTVDGPVEINGQQQQAGPLAQIQ